VTAISINHALAFVPRIGTKAKSIYESIYLFFASLPARRIIISVISILIVVQGVRSVLPFTLLYAQWTPLIESLFAVLTGIDQFSIVILFALLWLTKFTSTDSEIKHDLFWLVLGILAKQFTWHFACVLVASIIGDFSQMAAYLNWCWIWTIVYGLGLYLLFTKGGDYVRIASKPARSNKKS
jgi:hypothetical protein